MLENGLLDGEKWLKRVVELSLRPTPINMVELTSLYMMMGAHLLQVQAEHAQSIMNTKY